MKLVSYRRVNIKKEDIPSEIRDSTSFIYGAFVAVVEAESGLIFKKRKSYGVFNGLGGWYSLYPFEPASYSVSESINKLISDKAKREIRAEALKREKEREQLKISVFKKAGLYND